MEATCGSDVETEREFFQEEETEEIGTSDRALVMSQIQPEGTGVDQTNTTKETSLT